MGFAAKSVVLIAVVLGLLALAGAPDVARADDCSSLLGMINQLKAHIPNEPRDAANDDRAQVNQYVILYNAKCTGSGGGGAAPSSGDARARCSAQIDNYNDALHRRVPPEFGRYLANQGLVILGSLMEPAKACGDVDVYRRIRRITMGFKLEAARQCEGVMQLHDDNGGLITPELVEQQIRDEEADIAKTGAAICDEAQAELAAPAPSSVPAPQAPRTATAPPKPPKPPKPSALDPGPPGVPKELFAAMKQCLADNADTGIPVDTPREAVNACNATYGTLFAGATPKQIQDAFVFAKYDNPQKPPPRSPKPTTTAGFPNSGGACVAWTNPRRTLCAGDDPGTRNCSCVTYHNTCTEMVTVYYSTIGANTSPGVLTLNRGDSGPACTTHPNESIQYQSMSIVPGGKF